MANNSFCDSLPNMTPLGYEMETNEGAQGTGGGGGEGVEEAEGEQEEPSSSSSWEQTDASVEETLEKFRQQWCQELSSASHNDLAADRSMSDSPEPHDANYSTIVERKARLLFLQGVQYEQNGKLYEAINFYRRAIQLVPDIEFRTFDTVKPRPRERLESETSQESSRDADVENNNAIESDLEEVEEEEPTDLITRFQQFCTKNQRVCSPDYEQRMTHISGLPMEVLLYIIRWVVSEDLDLHSLEMISMVSRGFYLCSRDPEIWRLTCFRVWGVNCGKPKKSCTWRQMFIERPRLRFEGCYISKTTYIRHGEHCFQDQFYRPWHLVEYFRYMRFFPDGLVLMLTTPDEPAVTVGQLRSRNTRHPAVLSGHYWLHDNKVTVFLKRRCDRGKLVNNRYRRRRDNQQNQEQGEQTFHVELEIKSYKNFQNWQLVWRRYTIHTKYKSGPESVSEFDLQGSKFPSMAFSRVRSYTAESETPL